MPGLDQGLNPWTPDRNADNPYAQDQDQERMRTLLYDARRQDLLMYQQQQQQQQQTDWERILAMFNSPHTATAHTAPHTTGETAEERAAREAAAAKIKGENDRDAAYTDYMEAVTTSTDYVNTQISEEDSRARLLGIDYKMDDTKKASRIQAQFDSVWGAEDQTRLDKLVEDWGNPLGFKSWLLRRTVDDTTDDTSGDTGGTKKKTTPKGKVKDKVKDKKPIAPIAPLIPILAGNRQNALGGQTSLLG